MVTRKQIEEFAAEIARRYSPEKIILFGSQAAGTVGSSRVDLQACKLEYSIVSPK